NPNDSIALQRVINSPARGIGKQTVEEITRRASDYGLSLWETIALVIEKPENLSMRAVSALKSFRRIITKLGDMAGVVHGRGDTETKRHGDTTIAESPRPPVSVSSS